MNKRKGVMGCVAAILVLVLVSVKGENEKNAQNIERRIALQTKKCDEAKKTKNEIAQKEGIRSTPKRKKSCI